MKTRFALAALLVIIAVAAFLRFDHLGEPSYWLDEVLSDRLTTNALQQPFWKWLTGFENEHGPLSFAVQFATRIAGRDEFAGRLAAALLGLGCIPLAWLATRSLPATALLALSPLHVYYSREARPYALLLFLTAALIVTLLHESRWFYALLLALLYSSAVAAPIVAAAAVAAFLSGKRHFAIAAAVATPLFLLLYRGGPSSKPDAPFSDLHLEFFIRLAKGFTVSAFGADILGRTAIVLLVLAVIGAVVMERRTRIVIVTMTLLPVVFALVSLKVFEHWFELRYIAAGVIGFALLAGEGLTFLSRRTPIALLLVAVIGWQLWPVLRREPFQKLDWRRIAATIARYAKPGDLILAAEPSTGIVLPYYLAPYHRDHDVIQMSIAPLAERMIHEYPAAWLVTAGGSHGAVSEWMCRYPVVLGSELDGFRMHYAGDFLRERAQEPEFRAATAARSGAWFREGWAAPEGGFQWAVGSQASVAIARWGLEDRVVRLHVMPMDHPSLPPQTMRVSVNSHGIGDVTLTGGWSEQTFRAPANVWVNGVNDITFTFGRARSPASLDPSNHDERPLAVSFGNIEIRGAAGFSPPALGGLKPAAPQAIAIAFIDERTAWRNTPPRITGHNDALIGRLGFDPALARKFDLDDLAATLAAGSDCEDDRAWLTRVYATIFQRAPTDPEIASLEAKRKKGDSRATIVRHLMKSPELRAIVQGR
ncbi:MAG TPA: hypothetical protein VKB93_26065 [Thermoanaerobaculia bacterium]|nr:hypothetical protein [Thermoanaerobaculia bacterium]